MVEDARQSHPRTFTSPSPAAASRGLGTAIRLDAGGRPRLPRLRTLAATSAACGATTRIRAARATSNPISTRSRSRANPSWTRTFSPGAEIYDVPARLRRALRHPAARPLRARDPRGDVGRGRAALAPRDVARRRTRRTVFVGRRRCAQRSVDPGPARPRDVRRQDVPLGALGSRRTTSTGKRVAVIGTGASAIQFVPDIQPKVGKLKLFQRTPPWIVPRQDRALSERERGVLRALACRAVAEPRAHLRAPRGRWRSRSSTPASRSSRSGSRSGTSNGRVRDPKLRAKLTPSYTMGCKRILLSDDYLPGGHEAERRRRHRFRSWRSAPSGVVTKDGTLHEVDTIIFGTGFQCRSTPSRSAFDGKGGRSPRGHVEATG